ncbi:cytochrome c [Bradyrhizobium sp. CSA207]|uniref:c-type cytochrome n=1 Tax=Bradyrhizobium sp. CSA207 TaxID=2698826 RepID=UPI0023B133A8|nr:cytochrome c [Bradyrhizobium sp. CSA207]MDE5447028.1 cytochrome c [Bradyrhizobium sp. CSA207]
MIEEACSGAAAHFAAVAVTVVALAAAYPATAQQNGDVDRAKIDQGRATFAEHCSPCHGPNMVNAGAITPDLRRFPDDEARFVTTVKSGKNNRMPPWSDFLSDDEITALWTYVASRRNP